MKKLLLILSIIVSVIGIANFYQRYKDPSYAQSYGNLYVNFHSSLAGNKIFDITNFLPGDSVSKTIDIKNKGDKKTEVLINADKKEGSIGNPKLENILDIKITQGATTIYSNKLVNFFNTNDIPLGELNKNQSKTYTFKVSFPESAGNEYQNKFVKFDLMFKDKKGEVKGEHDERDDDDDRKHGFKKFVDYCKSAFQKFFKFSKR